MSESYIVVGDCREALREMPAESVHCCVTSPPYFGLRDYGHAGQLGLEKTPEEYIAGMVEVFREVRRVLRSDGTLWLNVGDSYAANWSSRRPTGGGGFKDDDRRERIKTPPPGLKSKDLIGIPWMLAFALRADGWYLRQDIIWHKPNPMPESVTDRCTKAHEYIFLLSKSPKYYYDNDAVAEPTVTAHEAKYDNGLNGHGGGVSHAGQGTSTRKFREDGLTRNRRSVWTITTKPFKGAHFATFPPDLIEPCILAGTSEQGCCAACGAPHKRIVERTKMEVKPGPSRADRSEGGKLRTQVNGTMTAPPTSKTVGWEASCGCKAETAPCVVLDPFFGAGTTGLVAQRHGRNWIGCELTETYAQMAFDRISQDS